MQKVAKVPVVMQMEALECGAASLCMILAYYKKWLPLEQVRVDCGVSRDGSNARNILKAARSYGLKAEGYRLEPSDLRNIQLPAIIHWNFNHFVVLNGFKKNAAIINDPGRGTVEVDLKEFDKAFTGIAIQFEKTDEFVPEGKPKSVWNFALKRLRGSQTALVMVMLFSTISAMIGVVTPLFSRVFMDNIISGKNPEWLVSFTMLYGAVILISITVTVLQSLAWMRINGRFAITASAEFMYHVLRLPMEFFSQRWVGDIASRQGDNESIASGMIQRLAPTIVNLALLVFYLTIMLRYSVLLTAIGVASLFFNMFFARWSSNKIMNLGRTAQNNAGKLSGVTISGIEMIETIKASGAENSFFERWAGYYTKQHNAKVGISKFSLYYGAIPGLLQQITNAAILMTGVYLIMEGNFTIGMLLAFQSFLASFMGPVNSFIQIGQEMIQMRTSMERVEDVLSYPIEDHGRAENPAADFAESDGGKLLGHLEMRNVTFGYSRLAEPLIKNFSLKLEPGKSVAFVGGSGCGKSTLAKLVTGLYKPWSGEILFDGKPRSEIDTYTFKSSVAMVDQEITLFEDTIGDNIRMWDGSIEDFAVIMAARDADIHDVIVSRPDGYRHMIKEGGKNFSGGQRQRMEIARVLASEPTIILLDEATSALDSKTEEMVMGNIRNLGCTCIVVAHRLSTIRDCDEIIVLDKGLVVERGTHEELYALNGKYTELVATE